GNVVILESTSPVGTTIQVSKWLADLRSDLTFPHAHGEESDIRVAYSPERILPGHALRELVENSRIIGGITPKCSKACASFYNIFIKGKMELTNSSTAEMVKLSENAFRDTNIAFSNELSIICHKLDINVWELIRLCNSHPRVNILDPGAGVGGHCIAVDPWFIIAKSPKESKIIRAARDVNNAKTKFVTDEIVKSANEFNTKKIVCMGVAFKKDVDDLRESPAKKIAVDIRNLGYEVEVVEPNIDNLPKELKEIDCNLVDLSAAFEDREDKLFVILVAHKEFINIANEFNSVKALDFCGILK
ncbi:MAG: nucleotide sugar dehydrogenase, partial [Legionellales bacterium]|nr:nucleotide sugar dehydrogenase [Legionellales bacterium]